MKNTEPEAKRRKTRRTVPVDSEYNLPGPSNQNVQVDHTEAVTPDIENNVRKRSKRTVPADSEYNLPGPSNQNVRAHRIETVTPNSENNVRKRSKGTIPADSEYNLPGPSNQIVRTHRIETITHNSENNVRKRSKGTVPADSEFNLPGPSNQMVRAHRNETVTPDRENNVRKRSKGTIPANSEYNLPGPSNQIVRAHRIETITHNSENNVRKRSKGTVPADSEFNLPGPSNQMVRAHRNETVTPDRENNVRKRSKGTIPANSEYNLPGPSNQIVRAHRIETVTHISENGRAQGRVPADSDQQFHSHRIGRIERVQLINFMCHANLVVEFNKNINIFVGCNGSGKSAIITAIVIGLGGNAAAAERSKNIAQLIRRGESSAMIEITLRNDGMDSYEIEKYGNRIIVHRTIRDNGTSQYRIKSAKGEIITQKLRDLQNMLMYMNIQVDNPICVLNQDAARSFLKDADPKKRHLLFSKATQLEKIIRIYEEAANTYQLAKAKFEILQQKLVKQIKDYREAKDHYERLMSVETLKEELRNLKIELEWNKVIEEETKYEVIANKLAEIKKTIEELNGSIEGWSDNMRQFNEEKENLIAELNGTKATIITTRLAHDSLRTSLKERRNQMALQETKFKGMTGKLKRLKKEINEMQKSIEDRQTSNRIEILRRENEKKLQILLAERDENRAKHVNVQKEVELLDKKSQEDESKLDDLQHKQRDAKNHMDKTNHEIREINVKSSNNLSIFGKHMPNLIVAIEKHHQLGKFSELPRGPIGRYVQVKNEKWSRLIEHILGGHLQYFIFNTHEDGLYFDTLIKREFPQIKARITKIVTKFCHTPYKVDANKVKVSRGSATILLDEIDVSDPVVLNVMIDQIHIETILMCSGTEEACRFTTEQSKVPKNLSKIFSLDPAAEYYPAPNFRSYGLDLRLSRLLQTDMKQYKIQLENDLAEATKVFKKVESELNAFNQAAKLSNERRKEQKAKLLKIENILRRLQGDIEDIENFEYPAQHEVDVLQNELKELQNEYDTTKSAIENEEQSSHTLKQQVKAIEHDIKINQDETKKLERSVNEKMEEIREITEKIDNLAINNVEADLKRNETERKKYEIEMGKQQKMLGTVKQRAAEKGDRIDKNRGADKIQSLIKSTENKIHKRCSSTDDITTVKNTMIEFERCYKETEASIEAFEALMKNITARREGRYSWLFNEYRPYITIRIKKQFALTLKSRKFGGEIHIDHKNKTLDISVVPQDKNIKDAVCNTKSLSGGERSFSTLAFLTSLWSCVASPFYVLDEYDVFTDQINRRFMAQLLLSEARRRTEQQFCFFTPQDMSFVEESDSITFHRLESHLQST